MAWCVDDLETWYLILEIETALHPLHVLLDRTLGEVCSTDLLGDSTGLTGLHVCPSELIKDQCLAGVDVAKNTEDGASQLDYVLL